MSHVVVTSRCGVNSKHIQGQINVVVVQLQGMLIAL